MRSHYDSALKNLSKELATLRVESVSAASVLVATEDDPPDFSPLIADKQMQAILVSRWVECGRCLKAQAPLAATVMMGGFLEALLLAQINKNPDKKMIFGAKSAPKDKSTGKARPLSDWTLRNYIDVAHEVGWISETAKDVGGVLRDYRNYIHPYKQLSHGITLDGNDAGLFWEITKSVSRQLLSP